MKCYLQCRRQISCLELFAGKHARECKTTDAEKLLSQWEKVAKCNFKSKAQVHERFFFMKWNVICNAEDRFSCVRAFLQSKSC